MLTIEHQKAQNGILGLFLLGIIYQFNFKNRQDWITLENFFSVRNLSSEFRRVGQIEGDSMRIILGETPNQRIYDFFGAAGARRLQRKVHDGSIVFKQAEGKFDVANFYLYPHEIDFGAYRHLPPYLGQVFHPFEDYFEIKIDEVVSTDRSSVLNNPVLITENTDYRLQNISLFFGEYFEVARIIIDWHENLRTEIDFSGKALIISYAQRGKHYKLDVKFTEIAVSLEEIGLALKAANYD